jgi:hypothetical protein
MKDLLHIDITLKDVASIGFAIQMLQRGNVNDKVRALTKIPCFSDLKIAVGCEDAFILHVSSTATEIIQGEWGEAAHKAFYLGVMRATTMLIEAENGHAGKD